MLHYCYYYTEVVKATLLGDEVMHLNPLTSIYTSRDFMYKPHSRGPYMVQFKHRVGDLTSGLLTPAAGGALGVTIF